MGNALVAGVFEKVGNIFMNDFKSYL